MGSEEIIEKILAKRPDITRAQLETMITEKKQASGDLLSIEGAAHLVAQDLLVQISQTRRGLRIADIIPQLGDATVTARVIAAWPKQSFKRKDGTDGAFVRLLLGDKTGAISCLIWNTDVIETIESNNIEDTIIEVSHGYTRTGLATNVELHVGNRGGLRLLLDSSNSEAYPPAESFMESLNQISHQAETANVQGTVTATPLISIFQTQDTTGTILRTSIEDKTGTVTVVAWNDKANQLKDVLVGDKIRIMNGLIRKTPEGQLELHLQRRSLVRLLDAVPERKLVMSIADIKTGAGPVNVVGRVVSAGPTREIQTRSGEKVPASNVLIGDGSGLVLATLWRKNSKLVEQLEEGEVVLIENAQTQERFSEFILNVGETGNVVSKPQSPAVSDLGYPPITQIKELKKGMPVIVEGAVVEDASLKEVELKNGGKTKVTSFRIRDPTGTVRVSFWRDLADAAMPLRRGDKIRIIGVRVKEGFADKWELHSSTLSKLKIIGKESMNIASPDRPIDFLS